MTSTDIIAWIGAISGSMALFWDIFKWLKYGARLKLKATTNTIPVGGLYPPSENELKIFVEVVNVGDKRTTLTNLSLFYYKSALRKTLKLKPTQCYAVPDPMIDKLPKAIDVGERWVGLINQDEKINQMLKTGCLFVGINHTSSKRTILEKLKTKSI